MSPQRCRPPRHVLPARGPPGFLGAPATRPQVPERSRAGPGSGPSRLLQAGASDVGESTSARQRVMEGGVGLRHSPRDPPPAQWEEPCVGLSRLPSFPLPEIDGLRISLPDGDFRVIHVPILTPTPKIWSEKRHPGTRESGGFLTAPPSRLSLTRPASRNGDPAQPRATLSAARLPPCTRPR